MFIVTAEEFRASWVTGNDLTSVEVTSNDTFSHRCIKHFTSKIMDESFDMMISIEKLDTVDNTMNLGMMSFDMLLDNGVLQ